MKKELSDAIHRFNLINKSKSQLADWNLIRKALSGSGQNSAEETQPSGETNKAMVPFSVIRDLVKSVEHMGVPFVECLVSFVELKKILKTAP